MFVRFRQFDNRLRLRLVETRRQADTVVHEHVASLGAIIVPPSVSDRITFWQKLHERLARLANRIDAETQGKILGAVHDRVPMVTIEEIHALQLENAEADEQFWARLQDMNETSAADHTALRTGIDNKIASFQAGAAPGKGRCCDCQGSRRTAETGRNRRRRINKIDDARRNREGNWLDSKRSATCQPPSCHS